MGSVSWREALAEPESAGSQQEPVTIPHAQYPHSVDAADSTALPCQRPRNDDGDGNDGEDRDDSVKFSFEI